MPASTKTPAKSRKNAAPKKPEPEPALTGEVIVPDQNAEALSTIALAINVEWGRGIDAQFAIGHLLIEARSLLPSNTEYGAWVDAQGFPFSKSTARNLRLGAEREPEVRAFIAERARQALVEGKHDKGEVGVSYAVNLLTGGQEGGTRAAAPSKAQAAAEKELGELSRTDSGFAAFRKGVYALLAYEVGEDGEGEFTGDLSQLAADELVEVAGLVMAVAEAYKVEKANRGA